MMGPNTTISLKWLAQSPTLTAVFEGQVFLASSPGGTMDRALVVTIPSLFS